MVFSLWQTCRYAYRENRADLLGTFVGSFAHGWPLATIATQPVGHGAIKAGLRRGGGGAHQAVEHQRQAQAQASGQPWTPQELVQILQDMLSMHGPAAREVC